MKGKMRIFLLATMLLMAQVHCKKAETHGPLGTVVFVGASITESWDFDHYFSGYNFQKVIHYDWDKTQVWDEVRDYDPDIVVVKECGAYFYADGGSPLADFQSCMSAMVDRIRASGAVPVLCTTLPVDVGAGDCTQAQLNDIRSFNGWLRSYCVAQGIVLLDYDNAIADGQGQLPASCHDGDGLHPNQAGYDIISPRVIPALEAAQ